MNYKFELDQVVWYMKDNKAHSAPVLSRMSVENLHPTWIETDVQKQTFTRFGISIIMYATIHGEFAESELHASRDEMYKALIFQ